MNPLDQIPALGVPSRPILSCQRDQLIFGSIKTDMGPHTCNGMMSALRTVSFFDRRISIVIKTPTWHRRVSDDLHDRRFNLPSHPSHLLQPKPVFYLSLRGKRKFKWRSGVTPRKESGREERRRNEKGS